MHLYDKKIFMFRQIKNKNQTFFRRHTILIFKQIKSKNETLYYETRGKYKLTDQENGIWLFRSTLYT